MKENQHLEFKRDMTRSFLKTVSAFANFGGGTILFGVDDSGNPTGLDNPDEIRLSIENSINDNISPEPDYSLTSEGNGVVRLEIREGKYKPYLYKGKAYRRADTATIEADQFETRRLVLEGSNYYFENLPCSNQKLEFDHFSKKAKKFAKDY